MSILARDQIRKRLESSDPEQQIFRPQSWEVACIRGAAYELRVAPDYLVLPCGKRYWPDATDPARRERLASFDLNPGQVAFVSSAERMWMPWDLAGNIAPKFRLALDGLLVMGGMLIDPGYGRFRRQGSTWVPRVEGARLHFQLANVGAAKFTIVPNETSMAAVQFLESAGNTRRFAQGEPEADLDLLEVPSPDRLLRDLFYDGADEPLPQLQFFPKTAGLQGQVDELDRGLTGDVSALRATVEASDKSIDRIIVAGFYVVLITIFGVAFAAILNAAIG